MANNSNVCTCGTCPGPDCTCGCQTVKATPPSGCQCGSTCNCGPACSCKRS